MRFSKPCHQPTFYYHIDYHSALRPVIARNSPHGCQHSSSFPLAPSLFTVLTPQNLLNRIYAKKHNMQTLPAWRSISSTLTKKHPFIDRMKPNEMANPKAAPSCLQCGEKTGLQSINQQKAASTHRHTTSRRAGRQWASVHTLSKEKLYYLFDFQLIGVSLVHALSNSVLLCYGCRAWGAI